MSVRGTGFLICLLVLSSSTAALAQARGATLRKRLDQRGDLIFVGNSVHSCTSGGSCNTAHNSGGSQNDNDYTMNFINVDSDATTFNASEADMALPSGATVTYARLYWFCTVGRGTNPAGWNGTTIDDRNKVKLKVAGATNYSTVTADVFDSGLLTPPLEPYGNPYMGSADVTSAVKAAGNGAYWVANMQCGSAASNLWSGWTLAVIYQRNADNLRTISVFDAYNQYINGNDITLNLSGFITPPSGPVNTKVGIVVGDGDSGYAEDSLTLNTTALSDNLNPADNIANSTISRGGVLVTNRNPNYVNTLGYDADIIDTTGILPNGATTATVHAHSGIEHVFVGIMSFSTQIFAPNLDTGSAGGKTVVDLNGGDANPGDILEYTIHLKNLGQDAAIDAKLFDNIPTNTTYVANSLKIGIGAAAPVAVSDDADNDTGELDSAASPKRVVARVGTGATGTSGGKVAVNATATVVFRVKINSGVPDGTVISNQATLDYAGETLGTGTRYTGFSDGDTQTAGDQPTTIIVHAAPHVVITGSGSYDDANTNDTLDPGEDVTFTLVVTNDGNDTAHGLVVSNPIDPNLVLGNVTSTAGTVTTGSTVSVDIGDLAVGEMVTIVIHATVKKPFPPSGNGQVSDQATADGDNFAHVTGNLVTLQVTTGCECLIDAVCYGTGTINAANACQKCDPLMSGTAWSPVAGGVSCDDGKVCTSDTTCDGSGSCGGGAVDCDDGLACTTGSCAQDGSCAQTTDADACIIDGACVAGGATAPGNECMACVPGTSQTGYTPVAGGSCNDGQFCTVEDTCNAEGTCVGTPRACTDALDCTTGSCDEDQDKCVFTIDQGCVIDGVCIPGGDPDPQNPCRVCDPVQSTTSYSNATQGTPCSDGNSCTEDSCNGSGQCDSTETTCVDDLACTVDACVPGTGCTHTVPSDKCINDQGNCVDDGSVDPTNVCRVCNPAMSTADYSNADPSTVCNDGKSCTTNDHCLNGECTGTLACNDGISCTLDTCGLNGECQNNLAPGFCRIEGLCVAGGSHNHANGCEVCDPSQSTSAWSIDEVCLVDGGSGGTPDASLADGHVVDSGGGGGGADGGGGGADSGGGGGGSDGGGGGGGGADSGGGGEVADASSGAADSGGGGGQVDAATSGGDASGGGGLDAAGGGIDARLADASGGTTDAGGGASADARRPDASTGSPLVPGNEFLEGGGCACRASSGAPAPQLPGFFLVGLAGVIVLRRRRR